MAYDFIKTFTALCSNYFKWGKTLYLPRFLWKGKLIYMFLLHKWRNRGHEFPKVGVIFPKILLQDMFFPKTLKNINALEVQKNRYATLFEIILPHCMTQTCTETCYHNGWNYFWSSIPNCLHLESGINNMNVSILWKRNCMKRRILLQKKNYPIVLRESNIENDDWCNVDGKT